MTRWLLVRGRGERPLPATGWSLERHASTRRPAVQKGDLAVCYASVWQAVFGVVEIASDPEHDPERERWGWSLALRPLLAVADLDDAPAAEEAGIFPSSLWRHSYIRLSEEQFARAASLVERAIVRSGYDAMAETYERWAASFHAPVLRTLERLLARLERGSRVLDLGCGNGVPVARTLLEHGHDLTGVDLSGAQLARARRNAPGGRYLHADALEVDFPPASFDAVVSTFVFGHVPRGELPELLARIRSWLRPGGRALLTFARSDTEAFVDEDWLGAPMFFSSHPPAVTRELLAAAGLEVEWEREVNQGAPGETFLWTLSRRPA